MRAIKIRVKVLHTNKCLSFQAYYIAMATSALLLCEISWVDELVQTSCSLADGLSNNDSTPTFSSWHQLFPEANNPIMTSEERAPSETYIWKAVLTNYTHSQWCPVLCFSSKTCQEFSETATSKARRCSGFVWNFIGGNNSALLGLLLKYKWGHGIRSLSATMVNNHWFVMNFKWLKSSIVCPQTHISALLVTRAS